MSTVVTARLEAGKAALDAGRWHAARDAFRDVLAQELALSMLADAGFTSVEVKDVEADVVNSYFVARKA